MCVCVCVYELAVQALVAFAGAVDEHVPIIFVAFSISGM